MSHDKNLVSRRIVTEKYIKIGDRVIVNYDRTSDAYNYLSKSDLEKDGKIGTVLSFHVYTTHVSRIRPYHKPGEYAVLGLPWVRFDDGTGYRMNPIDLSWYDMGTDIYEKRLEERRELVNGDNGFKRESDLRQMYLGPLPDLPFWEGDEVEVLGDTCYYGRRPRVESINYHYISKKRDNGDPMPLYNVSADGCGLSAYEETELRLVKRGNLYNHYNGLPCEFKNLEDEAKFASVLGKVSQLRNPITGDYGWTKEQVLDAIREGRAHGMVLTNGLFGSPRSPYAIRYEDEELGRRVAAHTLQGFGIVQQG